MVRFGFQSQTKKIVRYFLESLIGRNFLGLRSPRWIDDFDVSRCQVCHSRFRANFISTSRHHCRSCGRCICGKCSTEKLTLEYCLSQGEVRVCDECFDEFNNRPRKLTLTTRRIDKTILFGDFLSTKTGNIVWIALEEDHQLHVYGARLDQVEDYIISLVACRKLTFHSFIRTFTFEDRDRIYQFTIEPSHRIELPNNDELRDRWKTSFDRLSFSVNLWFEAIQLAKSKCLPGWYLQKRISSDSGVSFSSN